MGDKCCYRQHVEPVQEGSLSDLEPIGTLTYTNNNVMGLLQRVRMMFMMRKWTDKSVELLWVNPWIQGPNRRIAQTASAGINRVNQDSIFGPALDEVQDSTSDSKAHTSVIVERSTLSFDRSTSLSDTVYGTLGSYPSPWPPHHRHRMVWPPECSDSVNPS